MSPVYGTVGLHGRFFLANFLHSLLFDLASFISFGTPLLVPFPIRSPSRKDPVAPLFAQLSKGSAVDAVVVHLLTACAKDKGALWATGPFSCSCHGSCNRMGALGTLGILLRVAQKNVVQMKRIQYRKTWIAIALGQVAVSQHQSNFIQAEDMLAARIKTLDLGLFALNLALNELFGARLAEKMAQPKRNGG